MRLHILDSNHQLVTKILFAIIRVVSRQPVLDIIKLARYRPDFYGRPMSRVTHEAMRGPSSWSEADRETMAALVAMTNQSEFCAKAHTAVAKLAYQSADSFPQSLSDSEIADLPQPLKATLLMLQKQAPDVDDMRAVLAAGASREQLEDALAVSFSFNIISRLANCFDFAVPGQDDLVAGEKYLLARG